jgi:diacylglycerol kinase
MASMVELSLKIDHSKKRLGNLWKTQRNYYIAGIFLTAVIVACMVWALTFID